MLNALLVLSLLRIDSVDTLHTQSITYEVSPVNNYRGTLILTDEYLQFQAVNPKKKGRSFTIPYSKIHSVKRRWAYIFPNRILVRTRTGKKYTFYTYRRKKIVRIVAAHIDRKKQQHQNSN